MKKILSVVAAAVIAFSFNACKDKNTPDEPGFKIEVSNVTGVSADVKVTPSDTTIYYYFDVLSKAEVDAGYTADTLAKYMKEAVEYYGYEFPYYLSKNVDEWTFELLPETDYVVYAVQIDSAYNAVGKWTTANFKTGKLEIKDTVNVTDNGEYYDLTAYELGTVVDIPVGASGALLELSFPDTLPTGAFTEDAFDSYYGAFYVVSETEYYPVISASLNGALAGTDYTLKGEIVATNAVKYVIDVTCAEGDINSLFGAPAKKAARKPLNRKAIR